MEDALRPYAARHGDSCRPRPGARLRLADVPPGVRADTAGSGHRVDLVPGRRRRRTRQPGPLT